MAENLSDRRVVPGHEKARPACWGGPGLGSRNYLEECTGAGAGAGALGQQDAARNEAAAATTASLTIFMMMLLFVGFYIFRDSRETTAEK